MGADNLSLRVRNITPFDANVKLLYTGDDPNWAFPNLDASGNPTSPSGRNFSLVNGKPIGWNFTQKTFKAIVTGPANWGTSFPTPYALQNADGSVWVTDGKTIPFAFNTAFTYKVSFVYASTPVTHTVNVTKGMPIDKMLRLSAEGIRDALITAGIPSDKAQLLDDATPIGMNMYYEDGFLKLKLETSQQLLGSAFQNNLQIGGQSSNWAGIDSRDGFNIQEDGWTKWIDVSDRSGGDYIELINSLVNQSLLTDELYKYSNNSSQVNEPLEWKKYDSAGFEATLTETTLIDPYQAQASHTVEPNILVDGQVYAQIKCLAGEYIDLTFYYDTAGILSTEQIETLEKILHEQKMDDMSYSEEKELNEVYDKAGRVITDTYSNFNGGGLKSSTNKLLIGLIVLLLIFRKDVGKE